MEFNASPSGSALTATAAAAFGAVGGGMASRGLVTLIPVSGKTDEATLKKEKYIKIGGRAAMIALGIYLASAIEGDDVVTAGTKGAAAGMAIVQTLDLVKDLAADSPSIKSGAAASTKTQKFLAATLGLGCPGDARLNGNAGYGKVIRDRYAGTPLNLNGVKGRKRKHLGMPAAPSRSTLWQDAIAQGQNAAANV